jgi:hypothetical protein
MGKWFVANQKTPTKIRFLISQWDLKRWGEIPTFVIQNKNNNIMDTKHYFCDCDYFHEDEQLWFGDLGFEADICETENEGLENAIKNCIYCRKIQLFSLTIGHNVIIIKWMLYTMKYHYFVNYYIV